MSSSLSSNLGYRPDIDGLRAIAIVSVVIFHAWPSLLPSGFIGVDVFFVISGYLITSIILRGIARRTFSLKEFYSKRIKRIFPALLLVLSFCLLFGWFALIADEFKMLGKHVAAAAVFISNFTLLKESGYFDAASELKPLRHLWSLGIEEQFYIVWPLLICFVVKSKAKLIYLAVFITVISFWLNVSRIEAHLAQTYYLPFARFWELLFGSILAQVTLEGGGWYGYVQRKYANLIAISGGILLALALILLNDAKLFPGWWALLPTAGSVMLIAAGSDAWINKNVLSLRPLVFVGLISYPLYLWHWPLLSFMQIIESSKPAGVLIFSAVCLAFFLAWLTYSLVERRLRHHPSPWTTIVLLVVLALFGVTGRLVEKIQLFPVRPVAAGVQDFERQMIREADTDSFCLNYASQYGKVLFDYCRADHLDLKNWVAIIGDSHAHVLFRGFSENMAKKGFGTILLANSSCPPYLGTATGKTEAELKLCTDRIEQIMGVLDKEKRIEKVVIATRGPVYIAGNGFGPAEKESVNLFIKSTDIQDMHAVPKQVFFTGLSRSFERINKHKKEIYYLLENPELGFVPTSCFGRPFTILNNKPECNVSYDTYKSRMDGYRSEVFKLKSRYPEVSLLDTESLFCDDHVCHAIIDNNLMYADDDHLSVDGSRYVAANLVSQMFQVDEPK